MFHRALAGSLRTAVTALALGLLSGTAWSQSPTLNFEQRVLQAVNDYRQQQGLGALHADPALALLAIGHSQDMALRRQLSHAGFERRFDRAGRARCVENLAARHDQPERLMAAWNASPAHHANLLEPQVQQVGIAVIDGYLTLLACTTPVPAATVAGNR